MSMKKRIFAGVLSAVTALSVAGCGASSESTGAPASEPASSGSTAAVSEVGTFPIVSEPITVKGLVVGRSTNTRDDRILWNKVSELTGINIEWECIDEEALATYLAGSEWPDFIHHALSSSLVNDYGVTGGRFVNYLDYLDYMPNLQAAMDKYPLMKKASIESNGEMYSLPGYEVSATTVSARPYVRTDVLEAAGLSMPTTTEEFYDALVTLKEKNGVASFIPEFSNDESYWGPMLFAAFGKGTNLNFDDDGTGTVVFNRTSEQMKLYLTYMNRLYSEGLIHQEYLTLDGTSRFDAAKSGKVAFIGSGEGNNIEASDFADGQFHLDCMAPLTSEYDDDQTILGKSGYFASGFYLNKDSEYITELCRMFDIMYATEEVAPGTGLLGESFTYGIKGVDWDYDEGDEKTYTLNAPESYDGAFTTYQYEELIWNNAGLADALAGYITSTPGNSQARQKGFVENVIPYQSEIYFPASMLKFTEDEQYVLDSRLTDIQTYYKEMEGKFITGVVDIETGWDEYCQTLEQMGVQEVLEVYQSAYDRWNNA